MPVPNEPNIYPHIADGHAELVMRLAEIIPPLVGMADVCVDFGIKDNREELISVRTTFSVTSDCPDAAMTFGFSAEWPPQAEPHADAELKWNAVHPETNELHCITHTLVPSDDGLKRRTLLRIFDLSVDNGNGTEPTRTSETLHPASSKTVVALARMAASVTRGQDALKKAF
jgi:hypothetical protein